MNLVSVNVLLRCKFSCQVGARVMRSTVIVDVGALEAPAEKEPASYLETARVWALYRVGGGAGDRAELMEVEEIYRPHT